MRRIHVSPKGYAGHGGKDVVDESGQIRTNTGRGKEGERKEERKNEYPITNKEYPMMKGRKKRITPPSGCACHLRKKCYVLSCTTVGGNGQALV